MSTSTDAARRALALLIGSGLLLSACATDPAEDPVQVRLEDLDSRVGRIDRIVSNQSLVQMTQRLDSMQTELRALRGRVDELQNENATLKREQRDLYADLDKRLNAAPPAPLASSEPPPAAGDEQSQYNKAFDALKARNYPAAVDGFRTLAAAFPNGQLADNTQYWLGETYLVTEEYDHAAAAFQRVLTTWPNSRKAPDALLKLGDTQIRQNKVALGRGSYQQVVARFPDSDAARLATERLKKLPAP